MKRNLTYITVNGYLRNSSLLTNFVELHGKTGKVLLDLKKQSGLFAGGYLFELT